jgi:hypothetical protein
MAPAMANGRCYHHGGPSPIGRRNGRFRYGRYTKKALAERAQAKLLRKQAKQEALSKIGEGWWAKHLLAEAFKLETAWMDRYERIGPKPGRRPKKPKPRPEFPDGYDCANPLHRGMFTKQAKARRAAERELARASMAKIDEIFAKRRAAKRMKRLKLR